MQSRNIFVLSLVIIILMLGFVFKIAVVVVLVAGLGTGIVKRPGGLSIETFRQEADKVIGGLDSKAIATQTAAGFVSLIADTAKQPPVVLGVRVSNESISTVADTLQSLPPQQLEQIKQLICKSATESGDQ